MDEHLGKKNAEISSSLCSSMGKVKMVESPAPRTSEGMGKRTSYITYVLCIFCLWSLGDPI